MQTPRKRLLNAMFLGLAGMTAGTAAAAGGQGSAGLVPPPSPLSVEARDASAPGLWPRARSLGLKPTKRAARGTETAASLPNGLTFYSGVRVEPASGLAPRITYSGVRYSLSTDWSSTLEASSQSAQEPGLRAYMLAGRIDRALPGGRGLSLGLQYNLQELDARSTTPYAATGGLAPGLGLRHPYAMAQGSGYELKVSFRYGERNSVGLSYGSALDVDAARAWHMGPLYDGRQYGLTGRHWLTPEWSLNYGVTASEQGGPRGQGLRFGFGYSF